MVTFPRATYLGGFASVRKKHVGNLHFGDELIGIGMFHPKQMSVKVSAITAIDVNGGQVAKSKVGAEVAFGVLGALGAQGSADRAVVEVHTNFGIAYFQIERRSPQQVKAGLSPWMQRHGIPFAA